jgi:hypothetical protein
VANVSEALSAVKETLLEDPAGGVDTIAEFCRRHKISQSFFYELRKRGLGPDELRLGSRVLISHEAGRRWRAAREAETAATTTPTRR